MPSYTPNNAGNVFPWLLLVNPGALLMILISALKNYCFNKETLFAYSFLHHV